MTMTHPRILLSTLVVAAVAISAHPAFADGKNEIRAVTFDEDGGTTRVHVRGAQTPTFTVYKLERPSRVVIDVPQARLAETLRGHEGASVFTPSTWAVSTIAAQQIDDGGEIVRVIVTMARPGRYDVKTDGNEVIVMVTARDAAPKAANPEALAKAQAESEQAKRAAAAAEQARAQAEKTSAAAQAEAERLRKAAAEQMVRAEAAQRGADEAKRAGQQASSQDIEKAKALAMTANAEAAKAKAQAARAQDEAGKAKQQVSVAVNEAVRMRSLAEQAKREAIIDTERARKEAAMAKQDVVRTRAEAEAAKQEAAKDMARTRAEVEAVKRDSAAVKRDAAEELAAANRARSEADVARKEADVARRDAATTKDAVVRAKAEAEVARADAARTKAEAEAARIEVEQARRDAAQKRTDLAKTNEVAMRAQREADAAKADAARARLEAKAARAEADAAKAAAAVDKRDAETDRKRAETARLEATQLQKDAKAQLAALDRKTQAIQALEDKARSAVAAAQAREEAAQETVARATRDREAAEAAAKQTALARDRSSTQVAADREKLIAEAKVAEDRLAKAKRAADEAELRKLAAETAATGAKKDLDHTRVTLATVEQQRSAAERAASEAARKRGEAEAAASDASRRRSEAETAAAFASRQRAEAESAAQVASRQRSEAELQRIAAEAQRKAAETAARDAQAAKVAADKQRAIAETAAQKAVGAKHDAEAGLEELMARRQAAEKAADQLETRSKAEAAAQAQVAAATARKATDDELAKARAQATKLADERKRAETELADRRKAVSTQQAETDRLELAAASARDAAEREEKRRARLAEQRIAEEQELARIKARKAEAIKVAAVPGTPKAAFVKDITFKGDDASSHVDIAMTGEGQVTLGAVSATHVELIIDGAELGAKLERKLDVSKFGTSVRAISSFRDRATPNRVRLVAELSSPVTPSFDRNATGVKWSFASDLVTKRAPRMQNLPPTVVGGFGAASTPIAQQSVSQVPGTVPRNRRVYRGATVDFDFKDAPIHDLLRTIADTGKVNIVVPDGISARVTVRLKRVPWDQALEVILASHGLWYRRDGNLFRIAPRKELDAEDEAEAARREAMIKSEVPRSEIVPLNYSSAADLQGKLQSMLSPKGRLEVDDRTNSLIINDVAGNRAEIMKLALQLDTQTPQISIEARIVEARSTFVRQFGIQWGGRALAGAAGGNATGLIFPSSIGVQGGNDSATVPSGGVAQPSDFAINLPAATGGGEGGAIGLSLGSVGGNFSLNLRLSALEDTGTVRIISAPKITVLNNKEAKISQGVSIPISVVSAAGTQTQFVQADLALTVTPYVSQRDCAIAMNLVVTKNEPDFVNVGARGDPSILRKEAKTSMLVNDGETSVLGGIYTRNSGLAYKKVPFFSDIPVLGWFFKNRRENDDRTEILVFITPKITNKALLRCQ